MSEDIIINAVSPKVRYIADGITKSFSFVFPIFSDQDMDVYIDDTLIKSGYSITGVGTSEGGEVIFNTAPKNGKSITLLRNLDIKRTSDFQESGAFRAKAINYELDYQIACLQQLNEQISRSVSFPPYSENAQTVNLPEPENGKAIVWDNNGASLRNSNLAYDDLEQLMIETKSTVLASEQNVINKEALAKTHEQNAANSKEEARKWAIGTIQEQPNGSAKYWAEKAQVATQGQLNETQITNCITKISQDIKLELNDGTLTLKAGSKVYVPNGVGVFKEILINSDISLTDTTNYNNLFVFYIDGRLERILSTQVFSGTDAPSGTNFLYWYDTKNNLIKRTTDGGSNWTSGNISFPLGLFSTNGAAFSSIDQVFNGFGYIGSTIFALPGVEGLIPDGRNTDGSLNNTKFTTTSVKTTSSFNNSRLNYAMLNSNGDVIRSDYSVTSYDSINNIISRPDGGLKNNCIFAICYNDSTRITSFNPKLPVKLADDQDVVHKTGDEEIYGVKTIVGAPRPLVVKNPDADFTYKSITSYSYMAFCDKNNQYAAYVGARSNRNGGHGAYMQCNPVDGVGTVGTIAVTTDANGVTTYAPTPPATDKSTQLATTEWVRNYGAILDYSSGVTITGDGNKTAPKNGVLMINASTLDNQGNEQVTLVIEGQTFYFGNGTVNLDSPHIGQIYFPMKSGQSYNISSPRWNKITARFFPYV